MGQVYCFYVIPCDLQEKLQEMISKRGYAADIIAWLQINSINNQDKDSISVSYGSDYGDIQDWLLDDGNILSSFAPYDDNDRVYRILARKLHLP